MKILPSKFGQHCRSNIRFMAMIIVAAVCLTFQNAAASESSEHRVNISNTKTIRITADKMIAELGADEVEFLGNVRVQQPGTVTTANRLKIVYDAAAVNKEGHSPGADDIRKIIASGRVKIVNEDIIAEGDFAEYTMISDVFILTGKPARVTRNGHLITGSKITLQRSDGTLTVESSGGVRVRAIFQP
jgi:lipopolysaccharide transport protein LptA